MERSAEIAARTGSKKLNFLVVKSESLIQQHRNCLEPQHHAVKGQEKQHAELYNRVVRRKSFMNSAKSRDHIARAKQMTPEERLEASAKLSEAVKEIELTGKRLRELSVRKARS
jgi:hypothetical protein